MASVRRGYWSQGLRWRRMPERSRKVSKGRGEASDGNVGQRGRSERVQNVLDRPGERGILTVCGESE